VTTKTLTADGVSATGQVLAPPADLRLMAAACVAWAVLAATLAWSGPARAAILSGLALLSLGVLGGQRRWRSWRGIDSRGSRSRPWRHGAPRRTPLVLLLVLAATAFLQVAATGHQLLHAVGPLDDLTTDRAVVTLTGRVATDPRAVTSARGQSTVLFRLDSATVSGRGKAATAYGMVLVRGSPELKQVPWGATISVSGRLSPMEPGDAEVAAIRVSRPALILESPGVVATAAEHLRAGLRDSVAGLPPDAQGLVPGLVIGDTSQLPPELDAAMRATGMTHLTAVSGSNVAVVLALAFGLSRLVGIPRRLRPWLGLLVLAGFVVLARPEPSVVRAATMGAIGVIGLSRNRQAAGLPVLGAAILVVLVLDPWLARSYGFALSTLATLGLLVFAGPWGATLAEAGHRRAGPWLARLRRRVVDPAARSARHHFGPATTRALDGTRLGAWAHRLRPASKGRASTGRAKAAEDTDRPTKGWTVLGTAVAVPLAAQVVCAPVIVLLQSSVSIVGILANLLAAPLVPLTTIGGVAVAVLALVWPTGAGWLAWVPGLPAIAIGRVGRVLADVPGGSIPWPDGAWGAFSLTALTIAVLLLGRSVTRWAGHRPMTALTILLVSLALLAPTRALTWPPPGWQLVACDVGQGDAMVLRTGSARAVLVDAGPDPDLVDGCLDRLGVESIDAVVLTHFHLDHAGGLEGATRDRTVGVLLTTWVTEPEDIVRGVRRWASDHHVPTQQLHADDSLNYGTLHAEVWWPERRISAGSIPNNASVVLAVETGGVRALLLGDIEREAGAAIASRIRRDASRMITSTTFDVVKTPHHGSANLDPKLMAAVRSPLAVISVGADNDYGHPAPSHLTLLHNLGYAVHRTDLDGDIAITRVHDQTTAITYR